MIAIAVDWSVAKKPAGNIWLAETNQGLLTRLEPMHLREEVVQEVIVRFSSGKRVFAGLDFGFSLPACFFRQNSFESLP